MGTDTGKTRPVAWSTRRHHAAELAVEACWLAAIVLVPLAINPWGFNYELSKVALFRALTLLMAAAHVLSLAWGPAPDRQRWLHRPLTRPIILIAVVLLFSVLTSISPGISLWGTTHRQQGAYLLGCFIIWALLVINHLRSSRQRRRLAATIAVTATIVALTPFAEALRWGENAFSWRPGGSLGNPIFLGAYLIMALPFTLAGLVEALEAKPRKPLGTAAHALAMALQFLALLITQSRGPWLGALAGLVLFAALMMWQKHRRLVLAGLGVGLLAAVALFLLLGLNFDLSPSSPLAQLPYVDRIIPPEGLEAGTIEVRLVLWEAAADIVTAWPNVGLEQDTRQVLRPFLGYGPDTAAIVYTSVYPPELAHIEDPGSIWDRAHNETLDVLTMYGWLGIAAAGVLAVAAVRRGVRLWRGATGVVERAWAVAPLAALAAHAAEVQFAFSLTTTAMMTWLCLAWLAAAAPLSGAAGKAGIAERRDDGAAAPGLPRRWRTYAVVSAILLVALALRLEGGFLWADTLVARARALDRTGEWRESIGAYDRALAIVPWQSSTHQLYAETLYNLARALPDDEVDAKAGLLGAAEDSLSRAIELEPLELEHYSNSGVLHAYWSETVDRTHLETAVSYYELAFILAPTRAELRLDLGHVYQNHALYDLALQQYAAALEIDPQLAQAHYDSGIAWLALDQLGEALAAFETALELAPGCEACSLAVQQLNQ